MADKPKPEENPFRAPESNAFPSSAKLAGDAPDQYVPCLLLFSLGVWCALVGMAILDALQWFSDDESPILFTRLSSIAIFAITLCIVIAFGVGTIVSICVRARLGTKRDRTVNHIYTFLIGFLIPLITAFFLFICRKYLDENFVFIAVPGTITIIFVAVEFVVLTANQLASSDRKTDISLSVDKPDGLVK